MNDEQLTSVQQNARPEVHKKSLIFLLPPDSSIEGHSLSQRLFQFACDAVLIITAYIIYVTNIYYMDLLYPNTTDILTITAFIYLVLSFISEVVINKKNRKPSTGYSIFYLIYSALYKKNLIEDGSMGIYANSARFALVKFFFIPLMINFCVGNSNNLIEEIQNLLSYSTVNTNFLSAFNDFYYPVIFSSLFFIDTLIFTFGYLVTSERLKNRVRSVEPTLAGWIFALICYPPFNNLPNLYMKWPATDFPKFNLEIQTFVLRLIIILFYIVYVWGSVALGSKASNLTNRGIVTKGPYKFVRHPAYISKNLAWWLSMLPTLNVGGIIIMFFWSSIYFFRAVTEERHLMADNDYREYCKKVKYRFIPYIY